MANRANVFGTGNQRIDGVLSGSKWDGPITYTFPSSDSQYPFGYTQSNLVGFGELSYAQKLAANFALTTTQFNKWAAAGGFAVEGFTNLSVDQRAAATSPDIFLANSSAPDTAFAYFPANLAEGGDVFFGDSGRAPLAGNYDWLTVLHELGHSLGLEHGHDNATFGNLPANVDSMEFTVMTYRSYIGHPANAYSNERFGYAQTYMMLDIAALQHMHGADFSSNSGNTIYKWYPNRGDTYVDGRLAIDAGGHKIFLTIWDGNGVDTYDLSAYRASVDINLAPGGHSVLGEGQLAYLGGGPNNGYARGSVFNAMQFNGDARSLIENATGGSGNDRLIGNYADNRLQGLLGGDRIFGVNGDDTLIGGAGNDIIYAGLGNDQVFGGSDHDYIYGQNGNDYIAAGAGRDTVIGGYGDDRIVGDSSAAARIPGYLFNDVLIGGTGNDSIYAGRGNDRVQGQSGYDRLDGGIGNDTLHGQSGNDIITGSHGHDIINGGDGRDRIMGGAGTDTLLGGAGVDTISSEAGNDVLRGGPSADVFVYRRGFDIDVISDYNNDVLDFTSLGLSQAQIRNVGVLENGYLKFKFGGGDQLWILNTRQGDIDNGDILV